MTRCLSSMLQVAGLIMLLTGVAGGWASAAEPRPPQAVASQKELNRVVADSKGLVLVKFTAAWCGFCRRMEPALEAVASESAGQVTLVTVDVDKAPELARAFGVEGIPHLVLFKMGRQTATSTGYLSKAELLEWLAPHMKKPADS